MRTLLFTGIMAAAAWVVQPSLSEEAPAAPTKVVIAPALTEAARALKAEIRRDRDANVEGAWDLYYFYGARSFEPVWLDDRSGQWQWTERAKSLTSAFDAADSLGLNPSDYALPALTTSTTEAAVSVELAATMAALQFGFDNYGGRLDPRTISSNLDMPRPQPNRGDLLRRLTEDAEPGKLLTDLAPTEFEFKALLELLANLKDTPELPPIGEGESLKPGATDQRVAALRVRLDVPAADGNETLYDDLLVDAVRAFQSQLGLTADGIVGNATRAALNRSGQITRDQIVVNLEKWRWLPRSRGDYRVEVNIPEYRLWVRRDEKVVHETKVVVGSTANQTPIFYDQIRHVVVNPYWNVPVSIARGEIGPQVRRDPGYLARREYELLSGGQVIDPYSVDWASVAPGTFPYSLRQKPGSQNALGQVKFLFPNKHDVYLHDTPEKSLFGTDVRAYSHGCVRVQNPFDFAEALLADEPKLTKQRLVDSFGPNERWFNMEVKVPVYLTYFTLRIAQDGTVKSFADIYGHDARIADALSGPAL